MGLSQVKKETCEGFNNLIAASSANKVYNESKEIMQEENPMMYDFFDISSKEFKEPWVLNSSAIAYRLLKIAANEEGYDLPLVGLPEITAVAVMFPENKKSYEYAVKLFATQDPELAMFALNLVTDRFKDDEDMVIVNFSTVMKTYKCLELALD